MPKIGYFVDVGSQCRAGALLGKTFCASRSRKFFIFLKNTSSVAGTFKKDRMEKFDLKKVLQLFSLKIFRQKTKNRKIGKIEKVGFQLKIFEFSKFSDFPVFDFRKISIEIQLFSKISIFPKDFRNLFLVEEKCSKFRNFLSDLVR